MSADADYLTRLQADYAAARKVAPPCPICDRESLRPCVREDRHRLGLTVSLCRHCGMMLVAPRPDDAWLTEFYARNYWPLYIGNRFRDADEMFRSDGCAERAAQILAGLAPHLPPTVGRYLDVGCGQGGMLAEFRRRFPAAELCGIEPSPDAAKFCLERHQLPVTCGDWRTLNAAELPGPFDCITMTHVLEHTAEPVPFVRQAAARLSAAGQIYVEVPDVLSDPWQSREFFHIAHLQYFNERSLRNLFARAGLQVDAVLRGLADVWPWAVGLIGRNSSAGPLPAADVPAAPPAYFAQLEAHLRARLPRRRKLTESLLQASRSVLDYVRGNK